MRDNSPHMPEAFHAPSQAALPIEDAR